MMKKILSSILIINSLSGCSQFNKTPPPIIPYQISKSPLDLSAYKNIPIVVGDNKVCLMTEDYSKYIQLLNVLKNHIILQEKTIQELQQYYSQQLTASKK